MVKDANLVFLNCLPSVQPWDSYSAQSGRHDAMVAEPNCCHPFETTDPDSAPVEHWTKLGMDSCMAAVALPSAVAVGSCLHAAVVRQSVALAVSSDQHCLARDHVAGLTRN